MREYLEKIEALVPDFQYVDADHNRIVLTVGFTVSFYFWGGHTNGKRQALVECVEAFEAAYGSELKWGCDPDTWKTRLLSDKKFPVFHDYVRTLDEDDAVQWHVSSSDDREEAGSYSVGCLTERGWQEKRISHFHFSVPRELIFHPEKHTQLEDLIFFCHGRLEPFHGHAGFSVIMTEQGIEWQPEEFDVTTRYLALYAGDHFDRSQAQNGIKSINWLTFISRTLTERIGGPDIFVAYCRHLGVEPIQRGNGFVIRAGEYPELGPINEPPPEAYVKANAILRLLRNGNFGSMGNGSFTGELRFNRCTTDLWIRRFDAPDIWPPSTFIGLPLTPIGKTPSKKMTLKTGDSCVLHGRYRHPGFGPMESEEDAAPQVVLLPGDIAPYWIKLGPHGEYLGRENVVWELVAKL